VLDNHALTFLPNLILGRYFCYLKTTCVIKLSIIIIIIQAYCCYRQNKLQEALELLRGQEETSAVLQLESQIFYRLGRMNDCMSSYMRSFKILKLTQFNGSEDKYHCCSGCKQINLMRLHSFEHSGIPVALSSHTILLAP